jgi:hypothetical protein
MQYTNTMDVYVVLSDSYDGDGALCHGVFADKGSAEKRILDEITTWPNEYRFTRNRDRWLLDGGENEYWIVTTKLETNFDVKEPEAC